MTGREVVNSWPDLAASRFEISPSADLRELKRDGDARGEQLMKRFTMKATLATDAFTVLLKMTKAVELNT